MCSSVVQLAPGSRELSQAEMRITAMLFSAKKKNSKLSWINKVIFSKENLSKLLS